mgnify:CR=1 FL=1
MVGTCCIDVIDNERIDTLGKNNEKRKISIRFYYPGEDEGNKKKAILLTEKKKKEFKPLVKETSYIRINNLENLEKDSLSALNFMCDEGKTSMLQDILAHRPTEVDIFAGDIIRLGHLYNVPTPYNQVLYDLIKIEEERLGA